LRLYNTVNLGGGKRRYDDEEAISQGWAMISIAQPQQEHTPASTPNTPLLEYIPYSDKYCC
jgi:hypothetical protein